MCDVKRVLAAAAMLLLLAVAPTAMAQDASVPQQRAETFLGRIVAGDFGPAYDDIFAGSRFVRSEPQLIDQLKTHTTSRAVRVDSATVDPAPYGPRPPAA